MLCLLFMLLKSVQSINFYDVLEVTPDATADEIKKSFRKLSR